MLNIRRDLHDAAERIATVVSRHVQRIARKERDFIFSLIVHINYKSINYVNMYADFTRYVTLLRKYVLLASWSELYIVHGSLEFPLKKEGVLP